VSRFRGWLARAGTFVGIGPHRDVDAELESHLQMQIDDGLRAGLSEDEARRAALAAIGSRAAIRDAYRDQAGVPLMRALGSALAHGARALVRHPRFSAAVVSVLALGVGPAVAMFALIDGLMFRPPAHVRAPDRLVQVLSAANYPQYDALRRQSALLEPAAFTRRTLTLGAGESARPIETQCVTASYFSVLGAPPSAGRTFAPDDDSPGGRPLAVLAHHLWRSGFGGDRAIVGRTVSIAGIPHDVIGIAPPDFRGLEMAAVDAWILLPAAPEACSLSGRSELSTTGGAWLRTIARLRDDVTLSQAEAETRALQLHAIRGPLSEAPARELRPISALRDAAVARDRRLALWVAAGAVLVLLIACANVAGLLATRALERDREIAVRLQLGASRTRVFVQLLAEQLMLVAACLAAAWLVSGWIGSGLGRFFPSSLHDPWMDVRTLAILAAVTVAAGLVSSLVPAMQTARTGALALWRSGPSNTDGRSRTRDVLIVVQVALALVLAIGAGLFARSVREAKSNLGYDLDGVIVATVDLDRAGIRRQADKREAFARMLASVRRLPVVESAALTTTSPLGSGQMYRVMPGGPPGAGAPAVMIGDVSPDYFRTLGTPIVEGRAFTSADALDGPRVAIVDADLARERWPGETVAGRCLPLRVGATCIEIVGTSRPRRIGSLLEPSREIFYPLRPDTSAVPQAILVRVNTAPRTTISAVAAAIRSAAPDLPHVNVRPLEDLVDVQARSWRLGARLFGLFGTVAVTLAAIGLYVSLSFAVRRRSTEIGVRMALGADRGAVARMVLSQGGRLIAAGFGLGLLAAWALGGAIERLLFGVAPTDVVSFAAALALLAAAAVAGCLLPALRATLIDPVVALRAE
jgi:predicted permease